MSGEHEKTLQLIKEKTELSKGLENNAFGAVVGDSEALLEFEKIHEGMRESKPVFLKCTAGLTATLDICLLVRHNGRGNFYFEIVCLLFEDFDDDKVIEVIRHHASTLTLLSVVLLMDTSEKLEQQLDNLEKVSKILNSTRQSKIALKALVQGEDSSQDFEKHRLEWLINSFRVGLNIVELDLFIHSSSLLFVEEWQQLADLGNERKILTKSLIVILNGTEEMNINVVSQFLDSVWDEESFMVFNDFTSGNILCDNLKSIDMVIGHSVSKITIFFNKTGKLVLQSNFADGSKVLSSVRNKWQIRELAVVREKTGNLVLDMFTTVGRTDETNAILDLLDELLPEFPNLFQVSINHEKLEDVGENGLALYNKHLKHKEAEYLSYLITQRRKGRYNRGKVMVMGDGEAGKTSTIRSLSGEVFNTRHIKTIVAKKVEVIDFEMNNWEKINSRRASVTTFARDLKYVAASVIQDKVEGVPPPPENEEAPVRAQISLPVENTTHVIGKALKEKTNTPDSAQNNIKSSIAMVSQLNEMKNVPKISVWDFGGQRVFDALHSLYLTNGGINVIVINVLKFSRDIEIESLKLFRWLASVSAYCPNSRSFIIGTRAGSMKRKKLFNVSEAIDKLLVYFEQLRIMFNEKDDLWFFPLENKTKKKKKTEQLNLIKKTVRKILLEEESDAIWNKKIELSWLFFMDLIYSWNQQVVSRHAFFDEASNSGFSEQSTNEMLSFFDSAGAILNFSELVSHEKKLSIVMEPNWLLDELGKLIMSKENGDLNKLKRRSDGSRRLVPLLRDNGILSSTILENLFDKKTLAPGQLDFLIEVCEKNLIIAPLELLPSSLKFPTRIEISNKFWLVPSFFSLDQTPEEKRIRIQRESLTKKKKKKNRTYLPKTKVEQEQMEAEEREANVVQRKVLWNENVPNGVFEAFVCSMIKIGSQKRTFKLEEMNEYFITASLHDISFEVVFLRQAEFLVNIYSNKSGIIEEISNILKEAYSSMCTLNSGVNISEDCFFNAPPIEVDEEQNADQECQTEGNTWACFLSHCWRDGTHEKVLGIAKCLREKGLKVWLDEEEMESDIHQHMHEGIMNSHTFVGFVTKQYLEATNDANNNAGKEFNFAANSCLEKIILVVLEPEFLDTSKWNSYRLKFHLPGAFYIDMSSEDKMETNVDSLVQRIHARILHMGLR